MEEFAERVSVKGETSGYHLGMDMLERVKGLAF